MRRSLVLALVVACRTPSPAVVRDAPPDAAPTLSPAPVVSASAAADPPAGPDVCAGFRESMQNAIKVGLAKFTPRDGTPVAPHTLVGYCRATPHGMWRVEMPDLAGADSFESTLYDIEARFRVVHVDAHGARAEHVMKETLYDYGGRSEPRAPVLFDFDGDGEPEIWVELHEEGDEGHRAAQIELLQFRGGAIATYGSTRALDLAGLEDVDHDGRPDLLVYAGYDDTLSSCGAGFPYDWPRARFVAHADGQGSFSLDDAAAKTYARTWCPAPPAAIRDGRDAICARLWSKTTPPRCTPKDCEDECGRAKTWFAKTPPFTF